MRSLSTYIGFIPGAQVIAFGVGVLEWIAGDSLEKWMKWMKWMMNKCG